LKQLFKGRDLFEELDNTRADNNTKTRAREYSRFIIFSIDGQKYGVPVNYARELTYCTGVDQTFASGCIEGALRLRGRTMPVVNSRALLDTTPGKTLPKESGRILVMKAHSLYFGMIMDEVHQIMTMDTQEILPMPFEARQSVTGLYESGENDNIMLLDMDHLIAEHADALQSMSRMENGDGQARDQKSIHHLITENGYLIFSVEHDYAVQIKDIQEIIPRNAVMNIPASKSDDSELINLRGLVVPVVNLRKFYGYQTSGTPGEQLIICRTESATVALEVDKIKTIFKQEQYFETPSLKSQLQPRKDTLDRLIDLSEGQGRQQHVLVVNVHNMVANHLLCGQCPPDNNMMPADADNMITQ
ncbi:MAG: chemotaxis protein CheW, partial [Desulfobacterales bacterium]|nr:chemotaxis protein CheW [Desulfobacterales bacterium]